MMLRCDHGIGFGKRKQRAVSATAELAVSLLLVSKLVIGVALAATPAGQTASAAAKAVPMMVIPGKLDVTNTGAGTYVIPIRTPPGTAGMVPALSLAYSSEGGDGFQGIGWTLAGLPSIERCPRTLEQDSVHGSINYDSNDRFCFGGQRLVLISGTYGADGSEYRTEIESFNKIVAHGTAGSGPAWFEVRTRTGQVTEFGNTTDSRVLVVSATSGVTSTARTWAVNRMSDSSGNYWTATYNCSAVSSACTDTTRISYGQVYPLEVDYTGNTRAGTSPYNSVKFSYASRADSAPAYRAGGVVQTTVVLTNIETYQGSNLVFDYRLAYRAGSSTERSRLTSVTLCNGALPQTCLNPTSFGWQGGQGSLTMTKSITSLVPAQGKQIAPGDYNGDGLTDVIPIGPSTCSPYDIYIGSNTSFDLVPWGTLHTPADGAPSCTVAPLAQALKVPNGIPYLLAQIITTGPTTSNLVVLNTQASNTEAQTYSLAGAQTLLPGDYNGDGLVDFFLQGASSTDIYIGNGMGGFTPGTGPPFSGPTVNAITAGDFDGDGCTDLAAVPISGGGSSDLYYSCNPAVASATMPSVSGYTVTLGDFNGDGKTDILLTSTSSAGQLYFSTGTGFVLSGCSVPSGWGNYTISTGNWNGDGRSDLLLVQPASGSPGTSEVWLSTGSCFTQARDGGNTPITITTVTTTPNAVIADWNNDGASDIWMQEPFNTGSTALDDKLYLFSFVPELMVSVSNGVGATSNISYDRINRNGDFYAKGSSATFPTIDIDGAYYVVSRTDLSSGLGTCNTASGYANCYSSTYAYAVGQTSVQGRRFLGFAQITITDLQSNIAQTTDYNLEFPFTGLIASQAKTYLGNTHDLSAVTNAYDDNSGCGVTPSSGVYFVCLTQTITSGYDLNDTAQFPTTTTDYTYDSYGNALTVNASVSDGSSKDTTNTYNNDTTHWFLGQLLTTSVNSVVGASNLTRQSSFAYDADTGLLTLEALESGVSSCNGGSAPCTLANAYTYDLFGNRITSEVYGPGLDPRMSYASYDSLGQFQTSGTNALGQTETWAYDPRFGVATSQTGPNGLTTTWSFDAFGRMTLESRPDTTKTALTYAYCSVSCPANGQYSIQSEDFAADGASQIGAISAHYYDMLARDIADDIQGFDGGNTRISTLYDLNGRIHQVSRPYFTTGGTPQYATLTQDALGRVIRSVTPNAADVTIYDFDGLVVSATNALSQTTTTIKNAQGLNASVEDTLGKTTTYVYDAFGDLLSVTDPAGNVVSNAYDIRGHRIQSTDPDMGTWTYAYNVVGELTQQTDAKGQSTSLTYDLVGRVLSRNEPGLYGSWTYGTNAVAHNVGKVTEAKACKAVAAATWGSSSWGSFSWSAACTTVVTDRTFTFDSTGRPNATVLQTSSNAYTYRTSYNTANGKPQGTSYPSGFLLGYSYNPYGYLCLLTEGINYGACAANTMPVVEAVTARDAEGHLTQSIAGNNVTTNQTFDAATGFVRSVRAGIGGAVASFDYSFDTIGNLSVRTDNNENYAEGFCYDPYNRLIHSAVGAIGTSDWGSSNWGGFFWGAPCGFSVAQHWGSPTQWGAFFWGATCSSPDCKSVSFDNNGIGNIATKSDIGSYSYPSAGSPRPHAVSSITGTVNGLINPLYSYDANGNMTCMSTGSACTGTVGRQVSVTAFNMAASVTAGSTAIAFEYDSEHQRVSQAVTISGVTATTVYLNDPASGALSEAVIASGGTVTWTDYVKLDGQIVAQRSSTFSTATWDSGSWGSLVWGVSIPASNWGAHNWLSFDWAGAPDSTWSYFTLDHLGSIAVIADAAGAVVQRLSYDAWGKQRNSNGTDIACGTITSSTTRGFTNQEQMSAQCLMNLNARIYDSSIGKFMAPDPIVGNLIQPGAFNRYAYVLNNPLSFTDPTGLDPWGFYLDHFAYGAYVGYSNSGNPNDPSTAANNAAADALARFINGVFDNIIDNFGVPAPTPGIEQVVVSGVFDPPLLPFPEFVDLTSLVRGIQVGTVDTSAGQQDGAPSAAGQGVQSTQSPNGGMFRTNATGCHEANGVCGIGAADGVFAFVPVGFGSLLATTGAGIVKDLTVFWSGRGIEQAATAWALRNGGKTLATSEFAVGAGASRETAAVASEALAQNAAGEVHIFQGLSIPNQFSEPASIWSTVEYPTLMNNPNVTGFNYHIIDELGGHTILRVPK